MMKYLLLIPAILCLNVLADPFLAEPFYTPNNVYEDLKKDPEKYKDKEMAFEGMITEFANSEKNTPYFKIILPNQEKAELWSAMLFNPDVGKGLKKGDVVRVFGYYEELDSEINSIGSNDSGFHLLTFCIANLSTQETYYLPQGVAQCEAWHRGELPKT